MFRLLHLISVTVDSTGTDIYTSFNKIIFLNNIKCHLQLLLWNGTPQSNLKSKYTVLVSSDRSVKMWGFIGDSYLCEVRRFPKNSQIVMLNNFFSHEFLEQYISHEFQRKVKSKSVCYSWERSLRYPKKTFKAKLPANRLFKEYDYSLLSQLVMTIIGFVANLATFITLKQNKAIFSAIIRILLINQSCVDSVSCLIAAILILQVTLYLDLHIKFTIHIYLSSLKMLLFVLKRVLFENLIKI